MVKKVKTLLSLFLMKGNRFFDNHPGAINYINNILGIIIGVGITLTILNKITLLISFIIIGLPLLVFYFFNEYFKATPDSIIYFEGMDSVEDCGEKIIEHMEEHYNKED